MMDSDDELLAEQNEVLQDYLSSLLTPPGESTASLPQNKTKSKFHPATKSTDSAGAQTVREICSFMTFQVQGIKVAIPLAAFAGVQRLIDVPEMQSNGQDWYMGCIQRDQTHVHLIDSKRLILPPEKDKSNVSVELSKQTLVMIDEGRVALLCDQVGTIARIKHAAIHWSNAQQKRAWLGGVISSERCVILDINGLLEAIAMRC
ncbi:MAG: chemotaxis protein CheW [Gammaproteobacteria bacterium]|nr:chemotaxis protein CheW [Gammaproteobacteria bacterium]MDH5730193.1 chemotaxis protein CheW [Gammaproteobacteria bacterium]